MLRPSQGTIAGRPNRPLVVRCGYDGSTRRVNFPSAASCRLDSLRMRIEECFSLTACPFFLTYTDDDGEEFSIRSDTDLTEAIAYFVSGDDDHVFSMHGSSDGSGARPLSLLAQKITMRVDIVVEYDGPSLSDTSSIASFRTSENSWHDGSSRHTMSYHSGLQDEGPSARQQRRSSITSDLTEAINDPLGVLQLASSPDSGDSSTGDSPPGSIMSLPRRRSEKVRSYASVYSGGTGSGLSNRLLRPDRPTILTALQGPLPLLGHDTAPAPSLLTQSELGTRWLREQSQLARRKLVPGFHAHPSVARQYDSDDDSLGSDEESFGDIALVRDARGKYYYSYETSSLSSRSDVDFDTAETAGPSTKARPLSGLSSSSSSSTESSPPETPYDSDSATEMVRISDPAPPPVLAPDCSACGVRLDYMRYVCQTCGEGDMWTVNAVGKAPFVPPRVSSETDGSDDTSSDGTAWGVARALSNSSGPESTGSQTVYNGLRSRSGSISTNASRGSLRAANGSDASPTSGSFRYGPTPPDSPSSPRSLAGDLASDKHHVLQRRPVPPRGYELCAGCIEIHGIAHSKAACKAARVERDASGRHKKRSRELRHTFREKIWGAEGWIDVDYSEDSECTICRSLLFHNRFKCVSCPKFDLCRSCYQKVEEIHPVHAFLSLPDKHLPQLGPSQVNGGGRGETRGETRPMRHPGAFCHNCLQDIVGPRFHCAVCPSWDLCIQCEGVSAPGDGSHTADHIMMKIPIPLASAEVEAVSRRARDRWFLQDSSTVAAASSSPRHRNSTAPSSRSSSPTNETVYAPARPTTKGSASSNGGAGGRVVSAPGSSLGFTPGQQAAPSQVVNIVARDALDHNTRCKNCNEWIMGRRYQCANCPSDPEAYNLCSICELRSYRIHDPRHIFFKFDRPLHLPLRSTRPFLPLLYKSRVGEVPAGSVINPRDPTAYLKHVLHRETLCDIHSDQIRGVWLRCAHCAAGFDICQEAEQVADHDATHVFVVFKARVDMTAFRALADLAATHSKPLLRQQVYIS